MKSRTVIALFVVLGVCDVAVFPKSMQQEDLNFNDSIIRCGLVVSEDLHLRESSCFRQMVQSQTWRFRSCKINYRIISGQAADDLANSLLNALPNCLKPRAVLSRIEYHFSN